MSECQNKRLNKIALSTKDRIEQENFLYAILFPTLLFECCESGLVLIVVDIVKVRSSIHGGIILNGSFSVSIYCLISVR